MTADAGFVELEASGETIGEAKWQALGSSNGSIRGSTATQ